MQFLELLRLAEQRDRPGIRPEVFDIHHQNPGGQTEDGRGHLTVFDPGRQDEYDDLFQALLDLIERAVE